MGLTDVMELSEKVGKKFKSRVVVNGNRFTLDVPKKFGFVTKKDKIELVEELRDSIVDYLREFPIVFDVTCDITYETIKVTFIG